MTAEDYADRLAQLDSTLRNIETVLDLDRLRKEKAELEDAASTPNLWDDQANAQRVTARLSYVQGEINKVERLRQRVDDAQVLLGLARDESDAGSLAEVGTEITALTKAIGELEVRTLLSGEYDSRDALVTIRSGAGGVDAADFAEMLMRMYLRWAERHGYPTEVYDTSFAEEAGIKSTTFAVKAPYAYGTLSVEQGTHRLVRISPFDNQGRRQTSFAAVEVAQLQNKATAMGVLKAKLLALKRAEETAKIDALRGDVAGAWGDQMRSYVLHPYQMVKDLRTEYETGNPSAIFDGDIDAFIEAGIRWRRQQRQ